MKCSGFGGGQSKLVFFSLDHAEEVHRESQEINDPAWDCTLIQKAKEHADLTVNAIYEWSDRDVWDFIADRKIDLNPLYSMGRTRVGCVGCPLARHSERIEDFRMFPTYKQAYINAAQRMLDNPTFRGCENSKWKTGEDVFNWWIEDGNKEVEGQMSLFDGEQQ